MTDYVYTGTTMYHKGEVYEKGDVVSDPPDAALEAFGDSLEEKDVHESDDSEDDSPYEVSDVDKGDQVVNEETFLDEEEEYEDADTEADSGNEICGAEMSNGETCTRPADECSYH